MSFIRSLLSTLRVVKSSNLNVVVGCVVSNSEMHEFDQRETDNMLFIIRGFWTTKRSIIYYNASCMYSIHILSLMFGTNMIIIMIMTTQLAIDEKNSSSPCNLTVRTNNNASCLVGHCNKNLQYREHNLLYMMKPNIIHGEMNVRWHCIAPNEYALYNIVENWEKTRENSKPPLEHLDGKGTKRSDITG